MLPQNNKLLKKSNSRNGRLLRNYNINLTQYDLMLKEQDGKCAICDRPASEFKRQLSIDHNHQTGQVRSLLCSSCNTGLGLFKDNSGLLWKAIGYLKKHKEKV